MSEEEIICPECNGKGYVMVGPDCDMPASMCCGGCYKACECETCEGRKTIEKLIEEEDE